MLNSTYQIQPIGFDSSKFNLSNSIRLLSQLDCIQYRTQTYQIQHLKFELNKFNSITSTRQTQTYQIQLNYFHNLIVFTVKLELIKLNSSKFNST